MDAIEAAGGEEQATEEQKKAVEDGFKEYDELTE
jgi:hypothetical protein